jgi:predicted PurR-regulated permease PerM
MRTAIENTTAAAAAVVALYALYELRHALLILYVAIVLAVLLDPLVNRVRRARIGRYRLGRGAAVTVVALFTAAALVLIGFVVVPPVARDATLLQAQWPQKSAELFDRMHGALPISRELTADTVAQWLRSLAGRSTVLTLGATVMDVLTTLVLAIYLMVDGSTAFDWGLSLVPDRRQAKLRIALRAAARRMQRWVGGQALLMLTHGGSALIVFWLMGLPYSVALAVFAAIINIIPVLGPILTLAAAGLVVVVTSPGKLLGVAIFYLAYHNAEGMYLQPRIMASAVGMPGVAIVAALLFGGEIAGFVGMAFAVPTAVLIAEVKAQYRPT